MAEVPKDYQQLKRRRNELQEVATVYAQELEDRFVDSILDRADGNISRAAKDFGMHRTLIHKNLRSRKDRDSESETRPTTDEEPDL
jgi:DNA-binding protein Fis